MLQVSFEEDKIIQTRIVLASGRYSLPIIKEKDNDISYIKTIDPSSQYLVCCRHAINYVVMKI